MDPVNWFLIIGAIPARDASHAEAARRYRDHLQGLAPLHRFKPFQGRRIGLRLRFRFWCDCRHRTFRRVKQLQCLQVVVTSASRCRQIPGCGLHRLGVKLSRRRVTIGRFPGFRLQPCLMGHMGALEPERHRNLQSVRGLEAQNPVQGCERLDE